MTSQPQALLLFPSNAGAWLYSKENMKPAPWNPYNVSVSCSNLLNIRNLHKTSTDQLEVWISDSCMTCNE